MNAKIEYIKYSVFVLNNLDPSICYPKLKEFVLIEIGYGFPHFQNLIRMIGNF
jgi:hypothetical protein